MSGLTEIKLAEKPKLRVAIVSTDGGAAVVDDPSSGLPQVDLAPGETIMLKVRVQRDDFKGNVAFGKEGAGRNLPFGVYVDNVGLNGLLVLQKQTERTFFVTADRGVRLQTRLFHLNTAAAGGHASHPILLRIRRPDTLTRVPK